MESVASILMLMFLVAVVLIVAMIPLFMFGFALMRAHHRVKRVMNHPRTRAVRDRVKAQS